MEHLADELDTGRFVGILLFEVHHKSKSPILERRVCWADDHGVPSSDDLISMLFQSLCDERGLPSHHIVGDGRCGNTSWRVGLHSLFYVSPGTRH